MSRVSMSLLLTAGLLITGCGAAPQGTPGAPPSSAATPTSTASPMATPSSSTTSGDVAGTDRMHFTFLMPATWTSFDFGARSVPKTEHVEISGAAFFASFVDNTFQDPCKHVMREPKVGSTTNAVVGALGEIPGVSSTPPVAATLAGQDATYLELQIPATLPCPPGDFLLWQDSPGNYWYPVAANELMRLWVLNEQATTVVMAARSWPGTPDATKQQLDQMLESIKFLP